MKKSEKSGQVRSGQVRIRIRIRIKSVVELIGENELGFTKDEVGLHFIR